MTAVDGQETQAQLASAASSEVIIELNEVNKWFGSFHVLKDINLTVHKGERIVVCGPSGSGKSTLIRCINRLEEHQRGDIVVDGIILDKNLKNIDHIRSEVGMVFQSFNLFPHLTVIDNITAAPVKVLGVDVEKAQVEARELIERVGLPEKENAYPRQLSGGQQQRVAIARALAMKPKVMLFDEPTSALDPEMISEVLNVMIDLSKQGMTMIVVSHEMGFARAAADRVILMHDGGIEEDAPPTEFFDAPKSEATKRFLAKILH